MFHLLGISWMGISTLLVIAAAVLVGVRVARSGDAERKLDSPQEILRRRYARGEIDHEEYSRRLRDLRR